MSAIQSLLRVMSLRDAEAMVLEAGKTPTLRRRGQVESLAMGALDARMIEDFVAPLMGDRPIGEPTAVPFRDDDGTTYNLTIERTSTGVKVVVRKGTVARKPSACATQYDATNQYYLALITPMGIYGYGLSKREAVLLQLQELVDCQRADPGGFAASLLRGPEARRSAGATADRV